MSELTTLVAQLTALNDMPPLVQVEYLLELESTALSAIRRMRREAIVKASSEQSITEVAEHLAEHLGGSPAAIHEAVMRYQTRARRG